MPRAPGSSSERDALVAQYADVMRHNVARLRGARSQQAVARAAGVGRTTVSNFETGDKRPSFALCVLLAHALGVTPAHLLTPTEFAAMSTTREESTDMEGNGVGSTNPARPGYIPTEDDIERVAAFAVRLARDGFTLPQATRIAAAAIRSLLIGAKEVELEAEKRGDPLPDPEP